MYVIDPVFDFFYNFWHTLSIAGVSIRMTLLKMVCFSRGRGNCARSIPERCRKTSWRVMISIIVLSVARAAQMLVIAEAAFMIHEGFSSVRLKMDISRSTKSRRRSSDADWFTTAWTSAHKALLRILSVMFGISNLERITSRNTSTAGSVDPVSFASTWPSRANALSWIW